MEDIKKLINEHLSALVTAAISAIVGIIFGIAYPKGDAFIHSAFITLAIISIIWSIYKSKEDEKGFFDDGVGGIKSPTGRTMMIMMGALIHTMWSFVLLIGISILIGIIVSIYRHIF